MRQIIGRLDVTALVADASDAGHLSEPGYVQVVTSVRSDEFQPPTGPEGAQVTLWIYTDDHQLIGEAVIAGDGLAALATELHLGPEWAS